MHKMQIDRQEARFLGSIVVYCRKTEKDGQRILVSTESVVLKILFLETWNISSNIFLH